MTWQKVGSNLNSICDSGQFETASFNWDQPAPAGDAAYFYARQDDKYVQAGSYGGMVTIFEATDNNVYPLIKFDAISGKSYVINCYVFTSSSVPISSDNTDRLKQVVGSGDVTPTVNVQFPEVETDITGAKTAAVQLQLVVLANSDGEVIINTDLLISASDTLADADTGGELYFDTAEVFEIQDIPLCNIVIDTLSKTDATGGDNGTITVTAINVTTPEFKVVSSSFDSGWQSSGEFTGLAADVYTVSARDFDEQTCVTSQNITINFIGTGVTTLNVINEDGILLNSKFSIDLSKNVVINTLVAKLIAYNTVTGNSFTLDTYNVDLGSGTIESGIQQFAIDTTRGYKLAIDDKFNFVKFTTKEKVGDNQFYLLELGQKIKWQTWLENVDVDEVFFDDTKPNDNKNFKSSNYSGTENYVIKLAVEVNLTGDDDLGRSITGNIVNIGGDLTTDVYKVSGDVDGQIQTVDPETNTQLGGAVLYNGKDTILKAIFSNQTNSAYAISRIEPVNSTGDGIFELSSINPRPANNLLKPLDGESALKISVVGNNVITECLIDGSLIEEGVNYKLSAKLQESSGPSDTIDWDSGDPIKWDNGDFVTYL